MRAVVAFVFVLTGLNVSAQRNCDTKFIIPAASLSKAPSSAIPPRDTVPGEIITIPVVIHIVYRSSEQNISNAQVMSQLKVLNDDFRKLNADTANTPSYFKNFAADSRIMFCLAQVDPQGRRTSGIIRRQTNREQFLGDDAVKYTAAGGDDAWDTERYLNIWVCNMFGRSLGYATVPGSQADRDGVVINWDVFGTTGSLRPPFDKGRTATHEVAHWLGLKHIWGDENCGSDDVDDTPQQKSYNYNCPSFPHVSSCSPNGYGDMFMNFMDLTNDACMNMFTNGQAKRMRSLFALNGMRNSFLNSYACDSSLATGAPIPEERPAVQPGAINIYPNPVLTTFTAEAVNGAVLSGSHYSIFNVQGQKISSGQFISDKQQISISHLPAGMYLLQITGGSNKQTFRLIKK